jgi:hypothetical protein
MSKQSSPAWVPVESSAIAALAYDAGTRTLSVRMTRTDSVYEYLDVSPEQFEELRTAGSIGQYFNQTIKFAHQSRKVGPA